MLRTIIDVASRQNTSPEAIAAELGRPLENTHTVDVRDGVARIPVCGPLFRYANLFTEISGATSYEVLATDLSAALDDPAVRAVVLDIDSPGGQVNGCGELAQMIHAARGRKPIVAHVSGMACSGAYWLAAAAERIVAVESAVVGSIGVCMEIVDDSARDKASGIVRLDIVSSQSPKKNANPFTEQGAAEVQSLVDGIAAVFVRSVARFRGTSESRVLASYGQGGVMVADAGATAGMVDAIATYEELHQELIGGTRIGARVTQGTHASGNISRMEAQRRREAVKRREELRRIKARRQQPAGSGRPPVSAVRTMARSALTERDRGRAAVALAEGALPPAKTAEHARGRDVVAFAEKHAGGRRR